MSDAKDQPAPAPPEQKVADWITRTTAILAVVAALSSGRWGASNLMAILEQGKVNDGWNFYQAKSLKEKSASASAGLAEALAQDLKLEGTSAVASYARLMRVEAERQAGEKSSVEDETRHHESRRDWYVEGSLWFQIAFSLLQVGVVLCTIAGASKSKTIWKVAIVFGLVGLLGLANGFLRKVPVPKAWVAFYVKYMENKIDTQTGTQSSK